MSPMGCYSCNGMGAYYTYQPGEVFNGFGAAASGFTFNGTQAWADWMACVNAYEKTGAVVPQCKKAVDAFRAALGQMGYGKLNLGAQWGKSDQAAYQSWADKNGLPKSPAGYGMPAEAHMPVMEQQVNQKIVTGSQTPVEYAEANGEIVPKSAVTKSIEKAGAGGALWLLLGAAAIGVGAIYVAKKKKKGGKDRPHMKAKMSEQTTLDSPGQFGK